MFLKEYEDKDGRKVWLDEHESKQLLSVAKPGKHTLAILLGLRSGLRVSEIIEVTPADVISTSAGPRVRVQSGKGDKYRETPAPPELYHQATSPVSLGHADPDDRLVDTRSPRTIRQWVYDYGEQLAEQTGDDGWRHLGPHDLRRTWATHLAGCDINPLLVCEWGGWEKLSTFLEHYHGIYSPDVQRQELRKVDWMDVESVADDQRDPELHLLPDEPNTAASTTPS